MGEAHDNGECHPVVGGPSGSLVLEGVPIWHPFFIVRPAWASLGGEQSVAASPPPARQGERLAEGKGARREAGSEGSRKQSAGLTNRNCI